MSLRPFFILGVAALIPQIANASPCTETSHTPYCTASSSASATCYLPTGAELSWAWTSSSGGSDIISLKVTGSGINDCEHVPLTATSGGLSLTIYGTYEPQSIYLYKGSEELESPSGTSLTAYVYGGMGDDYIEGSDSTDITEHLHGEFDRDIILTRGGGGYAYGGDEVDILIGGSGADYLFGEGDADILQGGGGDDHLYGDDDNFMTGDLSSNSIFGGDGDDHIYGSTGNDKLAGFRHVDASSVWAELGPEDEVGNDTLYGGGGSDEFFGGMGDDTMFSGDPLSLIDGARDDFFGGDDHDTITGSSDTSFPADHIEGGAGSDTIYAEDGDDVIHGGSEVDEIYGGDGADQIFGEGGEDILFGEDGDDIMDGGDESDHMWGGFGNDTMDGGSGNDLMEGGPDNDRMCGQGGYDFMFGDNGAATHFFGHCDYVNGGTSGTSPFIQQEVYGDPGSMDFCSADNEYTDMSCEIWMVSPNVDDSCLSNVHPDITKDYNGEPIEECQAGFGQIH